MAEENEKDEQKEPGKASLDDAVEDAKKTASALQGLLSKVSSGEGFFKREIEQENVIEPKLIHEKKKIAEDYAMEDVPITDRIQPGSRVKKRPSFIDAVEEKEEEAAEAIPPLPPAPKAAPEKKEEENVYVKLERFFSDFLGGYDVRYQRWENSVSNILSILRKMRKITKKNTEDLVNSVNNMYTKIQEGLDQFKTKRDEVEKIAGVNIDNMSGEFKRVLGLLELQIKEYKLRKDSSDLIKDIQLFSR